MRYLYTRTDISCTKSITVLSILTISKPVHFQAKSNNRRKFHQFPRLLKYTHILKPKYPLSTAQIFLIDGFLIDSSDQQ